MSRARPNSRRSRARTGRDGRLITGDEPAVALRSVELRGQNAARWSRDLAALVPALDASEVERLLDGDELLRGIIAARELREPAFARRLRELTADPDETIAREAGRALRSLQPVALNVEPPELEIRAAAALLDAIDSVARRQLVRLLGALPEAAREVRARRPRPRRGHRGRAAGRFVGPRLGDARERCARRESRRAAVLIPAIRAAELPPAGRAGVEHDDRMLLAAIREIVIAWLVGRGAPELLGSHLGRCVTGRPDFYDDVALTVLALTTPLPETVLQPPEVRDGFVFVAPVAHCIGQDDRPGALPNPPRQATPAGGGFLISVRFVT